VATPRIIFSEFVEAELAAIWDYVAADNIEAADRFLESADATFRSLARTPGMGWRRKCAHERLLELRSFRVQGFESFLVFYSPIVDGIEVFHVLHGARDIDAFWEGE